MRAAPVEQAAPHQRGVARLRPQRRPLEREHGEEVPGTVGAAVGEEPHRHRDGPEVIRRHGIDVEERDRRAVRDAAMDARQSGRRDGRGEREEDARGGAEAAHVRLEHGADPGDEVLAEGIGEAFEIDGAVRRHARVGGERGGVEVAFTGEVHRHGGAGGGRRVAGDRDDAIVGKATGQRRDHDQ